MSTSAASSLKIVDSHVHVWANAEESAAAYPYLVDPPPHLKDAASTSELLRHMDRHGVAGTLIVQPINHKFDHSYVERAIRQHPHRFKGMMLHDPSMTASGATALVRELASKGFVGVRFNPYLWPEVVRGSDDAAAEGNNSINQPVRALMSDIDGSGLAVYKLCGELGLPVGIMCMQGFGLHLVDIKALLEASPETSLIIDHYGFASLDETRNRAFEELLAMAKKYPQVAVKVSAPFRLIKESKGSDQADHIKRFERVREERFAPLLQAVGSERLLYGSDFPYVLDHAKSYGDMVDIVSGWIESESDRRRILGENAERLFGSWGEEVDKKGAAAAASIVGSASGHSEL
jgi:predicted TIM-barrel fold metal-dependent hydrolase